MKGNLKEGGREEMIFTREMGRGYSSMMTETLLGGREWWWEVFVDRGCNVGRGGGIWDGWWRGEYAG